MTAHCRLKVLTLVGTRPEVIKLSRVITLLDEHVDHVLVHSGQNHEYALNEIFFRELDLPQPRHILGAVGDSPAKTIGLVISRVDEVLQLERPDALLVYGDTNTGLGAIAAKRRQVPVFHMEAGNRCFDERVPEEMNRRIIDHLSDVNLTNTEHARRYLLAEGLRPEMVVCTGSPMKEVLTHYGPKIAVSDVLDREGLVEGDYILVSAHREENVDEPARLRELLDTLVGISDVFGRDVVVSTHPRTRERLGEMDRPPALRFCSPFGFPDYVRLETGAFCVVSDSGTLTEESALLGFPAVAIREAHERPEGIDAGALIVGGLNTERVLQAITVVTTTGAAPTGSIADYDVDDVAQRVLRAILSYVDYVNRVIWRRVTV